VRWRRRGSWLHLVESDDAVVAGDTAPRDRVVRVAIIDRAQERNARADIDSLERIGVNGPERARRLQRRGDG
jgi:hypothetical protein